MANIEKKGRNSNRPMGSGLAAVRPETFNPGPVEHTIIETTEVKQPNIKEKTNPYNVLDQLKAASRLIVTEPSTSPLNPAKNGWTGHS